MLGKRFTIFAKTTIPPYQNVKSLHFKDAWDSHERINSNYFIFECYNIHDSSHLFGQCWHFVGSIVGSTLFSLSAQGNYNGWLDVGPTSLVQQAMHMSMEYQQSLSIDALNQCWINMI